MTIITIELQNKKSNMKTQTLKKYVRKALKFLNKNNWTTGAMIRNEGLDKIDPKKCQFCVSGAAAYFYLKAQKKEKITKQNIEKIGDEFSNFFYMREGKNSLIGYNDNGGYFSKMKEDISSTLKSF